MKCLKLLVHHYSPRCFEHCYVNSEMKDMKANHAESLTLSMHLLTELYENARETVKNNMGVAPA